jgi:menaquinone-specific isochorismate synthase
VNETPEVPTLTVVTEEFSSSGELLAFLDPEFPFLFQRQGRGIVGQGVALDATFRGESRFSEASAWWQSLRDSAQITNPIGTPGTGLVGFSQFPFSPDSAHLGRVIIPRLVIGRDDAGWWLTRMGSASDSPLEREHASSDSESEVVWESKPLSEKQFVEAVARVITVMSAAPLHKVVLARMLVGHAESPLSLDHALTNLGSAYPDTHLFAMGGFIGASPETLASVEENTLSLRVLAGSSARGTDPDSDHQQAAQLATSAKDLDEHEYAVSNVIDSLSHAGIAAVASDAPRAIKLPNLWHLATDIRADFPEGTCVLDLVGALHPTAAVAGTPTDAALSAITTYEPFDRGYFAGPIGWLDGEGNGEFAIALRCAELSDDRLTVTAHAGAGIVKDSDPRAELLETELKFRPIVEAFRSI